MNQLTNVTVRFTDQFVDYKGNPILIQQHKLTALIFVSLYCSTCVEFLPDIATLTEEFPNIEVILFCNGTTDEHDEMINYFNWKFPIVFMEPVEADKRYQITEFPYMMLVNDEALVWKETIEEVDELIVTIKSRGV
ncbi:hypothetical protein NQ117_00850 [Paenibacillus sp. SC116]|uniref:thioredoxin-like domain-containing protein n=1 Tax=Paenibacillus sp. SC116 TaxID=2968986 RepID=UPI00215A416B|nr:thioredoxin-like domain-containing protein [Paenibacillus sp. SC116]MCR8842221.1 hypothetical protein [Paenibacillus sp. SC116]